MLFPFSERKVPYRCIERKVKGLTPWSPAGLVPKLGVELGLPEACSRTLMVSFWRESIIPSQAVDIGNVWGTHSTLTFPGPSYTQMVDCAGQLPYVAWQGSMGKQT